MLLTLACEWLDIVADSLWLTNFDSNGWISSKICADLGHNNLLFPQACVEQRSTHLLFTVHSIIPFIIWRSPLNPDSTQLFADSYSFIFILFLYFEVWYFYKLKLSARFTHVYNVFCSSLPPATLFFIPSHSLSFSTFPTFTSFLYSIPIIRQFN